MSTSSTFIEAIKTQLSKIKTTVEADLKPIASHIETAVENEIKVIEKDIIYDADKAILNVESEITKLKSLATAKLEALVKNNATITSLQALGATLEADAKKAADFAEKLLNVTTAVKPVSTTPVVSSITTPTT